MIPQLLVVILISCTARSELVSKLVTVCPASERNATCKSLTEYMSDSDDYFTNDTKVVFLPGTHWLSDVLVIAGVSNLSLSCEQSSSKADIHCDGLGGLVFNGSRSITIKNIKIISCGVSTSQLAGSPLAALSFERVAGVTLDHVEVNNSTGYGVYAAEVSEQVTLQHSLFWNNNGETFVGGNAKFSFLQDCPAGLNSSLLIHSTVFSNGSTVTNLTNDASGLVIDGWCPGMTIYLCNVTANNNLGGNIQLNVIAHNWRILLSNSTITDGSGAKGSGLYFESKLHSEQSCDNAAAENTDVDSLQIVNTTFKGNVAERFGGGLVVKLHDTDCKPANVTLHNCTFHGNEVTGPNGQGAAIKMYKYPTPRLNAHILPVYRVSIANSRFSQNIVHGIDASTLKLRNIERTDIQNCNFTDNIGTAIAMTSSSVVFSRNILFDNNAAVNGGALRFCDSSAMFLKNRTTVTFTNNHANLTGGAIFAQDSCLDEHKACFFQPIVRSNALVEDLSEYEMQLYFAGNVAVEAGDAVYGGEIDSCYTYARLRNSSYDVSANHYFSREVFNSISSGLHTDSNQEISSEPSRVTLCGPSEGQRNATLHVIPGVPFNVCVVAVGQRLGVTPAFITAEVTSNNAMIIPVDPNRKATRECACLQLVLQTAHIDQEIVYEVVLKVQKSQPQFQDQDEHQHFNISVKPCPWGFQLREDRCDCSRYLCPKLKYCQCDINTLSLVITHADHDIAWIGCDNASMHGDCSGKELLYSNGCGRQEYCNHSHSYLYLAAFSAGDICAKHRTGILCGSCQPGLSVVLGTGRCEYCPQSNKYLSLVVVYLAAGILLVIMLTKFTRNVSNGSLNGLIFYANLVHQNRGAIFPQFHNADLLRLVIAWLNLDLGIEVCFFNGMTALHVIWLQIGYIFYIVLLQVAIILLCRRYVIFTRFFGRNVTKVLSTLVTLLYAKTLTTVADVFGYAEIRSETGERFKVLSVDGNIRFGAHQHIPLLVVASVLAIFIAVFSFSLLFIQVLIKLSSWRFFRWVARFQPFFETITGPCNFNYAFWPGYLFLLRVVVVISQHCFGTKINRYISTFLAVLTIIFSFLGPKGVYKKWSLNMFELSLMVNLAITFVLRSGGKYGQIEVFSGHISVVISLFLYLAYHVYLYNMWFKKKFVKLLKIRWLKCPNRGPGESPALVTCTDVTVSTCLPAEQTPLLPAAQGMPPVMKYDKLREPLMEF